MHLADWIVVLVYLVFGLVVGIVLRRGAGQDRVSFFLAGRSLPWWWAGLSMAATTFAADTPLAVTGIIANRGLSGNWLWLSWMGAHVAVAVYFAARWRRAEVLTDAELVAIRYSGAAAAPLRLFRAGLAGLLMNCITLGWVLRAMVKIAQPFFPWAEWTPGLVGALERIWPSGGALGTPADGLTVILLLALVGVYATLSGIRGVVFTDLFQLLIAFVGGVVLAVFAWREVGGREGLLGGLAELYGGGHGLLALFPSTDAPWLAVLGATPAMIALYLFVQSVATPSVDGGGYFMQRLSATRAPGQARGAAAVFLAIHYLVRVWPWFVVGLAALVLIPLAGAGDPSGLVRADLADAVVADRELAYPVLMLTLMPPVLLGLTLTGLLAAFMSTVDTHVNWGASYLVNDLYLRLRPDATDAQQVRMARFAVAGFTLLALLVSFRIGSIEQAWRWVSAVGAAAGVPTLLRWVWWRVTAVSEIAAMTCGLGAAVVLYGLSDVAFERAMIGIAGCSAVGMLAAIALGPPTDPAVVRAFVERVRPHGFWPGRSAATGCRELAIDLARIAIGIGGVVALLTAGHRAILLGDAARAALLAVFGATLLAAALVPGERESSRAAGDRPEGAP